MNPSKTVLITGCTCGRGRAMVEVLIARGRTVAGCGRDEARLDELNQKHGSEHRFRACDVSDDGQVASFCAEMTAGRGLPDLVLDNGKPLTAPG